MVEYFGEQLDGYVFSQFGRVRVVRRVAILAASFVRTSQALDRAHFIPAVTGQGDFSEAADVAIATRLAML
jgi:hypothetical protein